MAQDIVSGLFGLSPAQVAQQQQQRTALQAQQYAAQDPFQRATAGMYQAGAGLAQAGAEGLFGMQNPEVAAAQQRQAMAQQMDLTTPQGALAAAKMAQDRGDVAMAAKLATLARQMEEEQSVQQFRAAQTQQMLTPKPEKIDMTNIEKLYAARNRALAAGNQQMANSIEAIIRKETKASGGGDKSSVTTEDGIPEEKIDFSKPQGRLYLKQHSEDLGQLRSSKSISKDASNTVDELLKDENISSLFGRGYTGVITSRMNPNAMRKLDHLKSIMKASGMQQLKGASGQSIGAMSQAEWPLVEGMIDSLDTTMSEEEARQTLNNIRARISGITSNIEQTYDDTWSRFPQLYKKVGDKKEQIGASSSGIPAGVDPKVWAVMTPEEKALWLK